MRIVDLSPGEEHRIQQVAEMLVEGFKEHWPDAWPDLDSALKEVKECFAEDRITRVAIDDNGNIIGWFGAIRGYGGNVWELHPIVVRREYQGRGVGRALVADLEDRIRERGGLTIWVGTDDEDNQTTLYGVNLYPNVLEHLSNIRNLNRHPYEFYQKLGFVIAGVVPDANGPGKPDILMAKTVLTEARNQKMALQQEIAHSVLPTNRRGGGLPVLSLVEGSLPATSFAFTQQHEIGRNKEIEKMKWVTRQGAKVDRVACPWLIARFIDREPEFIFVPREEVLSTAREQGAKSFDAEGADYTHIGNKCTFEVLLDAFDLVDPALHKLAAIVHGADIAGEEASNPYSSGLKAIAEGFSLIHESDHLILDEEFPVYDALYRWCQEQEKS